MRLKYFAFCAAIAVATGAAGSASAVEFVTNGSFDENGGNGQIGFNTYVTGWNVAAPPSSYVFVFGPNTADTSGAWGQYCAPQSPSGTGCGPLMLWGSNNGGPDVITNSPNGGAFLALDGDFQTSPLTQTIDHLVPGQSYTLSFAYAFGQQYGYSQSVTEDVTVGLGSFSNTLPGAFSDCDGSGDNCSGGYLNPEHGFSGWSSYTTTIVASASSETLSFLAGGSKQVPPFALISDVSLTGPAAPEASTWMMMLAGFAGLGYAGFRSGRRRAAEAA